MLLQSVFQYKGQLMCLLVQYKNGQQFKAGDGIVKKGVEANIYNIGKLAKEGMKETDKEIIRLIMG